MLSIITNGEKKTPPSAICLEDYISVFKKKQKTNKTPKPKQMELFKNEVQCFL